jgi:hypothetical protein
MLPEVNLQDAEENDRRIEPVSRHEEVDSEPDFAEFE